MGGAQGSDAGEWRPLTMPIYKGQLNEAQLAAVVAYVRCMPTPDRPECDGVAAAP